MHLKPNTSDFPLESWSLFQSFKRAGGLCANASAASATNSAAANAGIQHPLVQSKWFALVHQIKDLNEVAGE
jgi:hypothetical protein